MEEKECAVRNWMLRLPLCMWLAIAVSRLIRAALLAARFSGRVRRPSFQRPASRDIDAKTKEILFLKDRVCQLEMQLSILQKERTKKGKKSR